MPLCNCARGYSLIDSSRKICMDIFGALSSPIRFRILRCLQLQGPSTYSEIMSSLELDPSRDAGKFAYHLKEVSQKGLISLDRETREYQLTSLGKMVLDFSQEIEEQILRKSGKLLVRTSRLTIEEFDRNKIVQALIREAGMPTELAEKISQIAEERLLRLSTKYLTAPLIREFVNAILIERGLEQYRHELTRLGIPVYDVTQTILKAKEARLGVEYIHKAAGDRVVEEYTLLSILPRKIADAHLSGQIHICSLGSWILKPASFSHDLHLLIHGPPTIWELTSSFDHPKSLESALLSISNLLKKSRYEISKEQLLNHFNVFLAPFAENLSNEAVEKCIRNFLMSVAQSEDAVFPSMLTLGLDLSIPDHLAEYELPVPDRGQAYYGDYIEESQLITESVLKSISSIKPDNPVQLPRLVFAIRETLKGGGSFDELFLEAHMLANENYIVSFSDLSADWQKGSVYFASGNRMSSDWSKDWQLDTSRTGILDTVVLNLPRLAYEARGSDRRFFEGLDDLVSLAIRCLEIKHSTIRDRIDQNLLPILSSPLSSESYMRLAYSQYSISFVGLYESLGLLTKTESPSQEDLISLATKILKEIKTSITNNQAGRKIRVGISSIGDVLASQRLAEIDVERFGWGNLMVQGSRQYPYYTHGSVLPLEERVPLSDRVSFEEALHPILSGGHKLNIHLSEEEDSPDELSKLTSELVNNHSLGFFTYSKNYTYCNNCRRSFGGIRMRCPECSSASMTRYVRYGDSFIPLDWCSSAQQIFITKRQDYHSPISLNDW